MTSATVSDANQENATSSFEIDVDEPPRVRAISSGFAEKWDRLGEICVGKDIVDEMKSTYVNYKKLGQIVAANAKVAYDYWAFVILASSIAAFGMGTNSSVTVVASMLISPIAGPILSFAYGLQAGDTRRMIHNFKAEIMSCTLCIFLGFIFSFALIDLATSDKTPTLPTNEMRSRAEPDALLPAAYIAFASGLAAGLGSASENLSGLIGVAISGSLLPPLVNSGIYLGLLAKGFNHKRSEIMREVCLGNGKLQEVTALLSFGEDFWNDAGNARIAGADFMLVSLLDDMGITPEEWKRGMNSTQRIAHMQTLHETYTTAAEDCSDNTFNFGARSLYTFLLAAENIVLICFGSYLIFLHKVRASRKREQDERAKKTPKRFSSLTTSTLQKDFMADDHTKELFRKLLTRLEILEKDVSSQKGRLATQ